MSKFIAVSYVDCVRVEYPFFDTRDSAQEACAGMPAEHVPHVEEATRQFYTRVKRRGKIVAVNLNGTLHYRVVSLPYGEESALYPLETCIKIVRAFENDRLLGSFGIDR